MYTKGERVPKDNIMAYILCNLAAAGGNVNGQKVKEILIQKMTKEDISKAQELSRQWVKDHAN